MVKVWYIVGSIAGLVKTTGAWGMDFVSSSPPYFQNFHNPSFFKIFIIIRFSSLTIPSWIIRVFCVHSFSIHVLFMMYDVYWYCQMKKKEWLWKFWKRNDYENFEKGMILKFLKKGGSREKGGGGNEIHAPLVCTSHDITL